MPSPSEFNLFLLLDLDPEVAWNAADIDRRLKEKRSEWAKLVNIPTKNGRAAKRNLESFKKLAEVAASEAALIEHANAAKKLRSAEQAEKQRELEQAIELLQVKGEVHRREVTELAKHFAGVCTEAQIRSRISVPIREGAEDVPAKKDLLEPSVANAIAEKLQELGHKSLYDFLCKEFDPNTHISELLKKAEEIRAAAIDDPTKDARLTSIQELVGHALVLFKTAESKKRYDDTFAEMAFDDLREQVNKSSEISNGSIDARQVELLVARFSQEANAKPQVVHEVILAHALAKGLRIVDPSASQAQGKLQVCGYDGQINPPQAVCCTSCGRPLVEECPKCSSPVPTDQGACANCGFPTGNKLLVEELCRQVDEACGDHDFELASKLLPQASRAWPQVTKGALAEKIRSLSERVQSATRDRDSKLALLRDAASQGRLYTARDLLDGVQHFFPPGAEALRSVREEVESGLRTTARLLEAARMQDARDPEAQVQAYQRVLEVCTDCREALEGLAKTPPERPQELRLRLSGNLVNLTWRPSPSSGVKYVVVRKTGSRPVSTADGVCLATVAACSYDDVSAEIGLPTFYGVFAIRGTTVSSDGALLQVPVQILGEVTNLTPRIENRRVLLQWTSPPNVHRVLVSRSPSDFVKTPKEGKDVPVLGDGQAADSDVENGRRYFYTVFSQFRGHDGDLVTTDGVGIQVVPQKPPDPIRELSISSEGSTGERRVRIRWEPPAIGDVLIVRSDAPFGRKCGDVVPQDALKGLGELLVGESGSASDQIKGALFRYYLPVVVFQNAAYLGQEHRFVSVDEATGLRDQNLGHAIRLQWDWPKGCNEVVLAHSCEGWPVVGAAGTTSESITRAQYDLRGCFDIDCRAQADYYIAIYTIYGHGSERVISAGACRKKIVIRSRMEVTYAIKRSFLSSDLKLELTVTGEGTLPELVLVRKQGGLPMSKTDGELAFHLSPAATKSKGESIKLPPEIRGNQYFGRLFLQDDDGYDFVTIRNPPDQKMMRLF
jgi:hypothetical protein